MNDSLETLRNEVDTIDRSLVELLNRRAEVAQRIGHIKSQSGASIYDPTREEIVYERVGQLNNGPLDPRSIRAIYREIISAAKALEGPTRIAYLGPQASFTQQAAMGCFGSSMEYLAVSSIPEIFSLVENRRVHHGVIPIENSTDGIVRHSLDMLVNSDLYIVNQVYLNIEHCLMSRSPLDKIRMVCSKDQALGQCREWLRTNLPNASQKEVESTSLAVLMASKEDGVAAIGSRVASSLYNVPILAQGIQDKSDNVTRFLVIGKEPTGPLGEGRDRTSIVVSLVDRVGALESTLNAFSENGINLCKIESRPTRRKSWDYYFFIDFIGHYQDPQVQKVMESLSAQSPFVKWLGSYPNTQLAGI